MRLPEGHPAWWAKRVLDRLQGGETWEAAIAGSPFDERHKGQFLVFLECMRNRQAIQ
jgi:hypothetical protein